MKILVCGSRDWTDHECIAHALYSLKGPGVTVIHGGARGADQMAAGIASGLGMEVQEFPADWRTHGRGAGFIRNLEMLDQRPDLVLAFQRNHSRGTQHTIDVARARGIAVEVFLTSR